MGFGDEVGDGGFLRWVGGPGWVSDGGRLGAGGDHAVVECNGVGFGNDLGDGCGGGEWSWKEALRPICVGLDGVCNWREG